MSDIEQNASISRKLGKRLSLQRELKGFDNSALAFEFFHRADGYWRRQTKSGNLASLSGTPKYGGNVRCHPHPVAAVEFQPALTEPSRIPTKRIVRMTMPCNRA